MSKLTTKISGKHDGFILDLERLLNTYKVELVARDPITIIDFDGANKLKLIRSAYRDTYNKDHIHYEFEGTFENE